MDHGVCSHLTTTVKVDVYRARVHVSHEIARTHESQTAQAAMVRNLMTGEPSRQAILRGTSLHKYLAKSMQIDEHTGLRADRDAQKDPSLCRVWTVLMPEVIVFQYAP